MFQQLPEELAYARELMDQAKLDEALEIIKQFEKKESLAPEDQLSALLIKGKIYLYQQRTRKALQFFEVAYQMSQELKLLPESVSALIGKAHVGLIGNGDEALTYVKEADKKLEALAEEPSIEKLKLDLFLIKSLLLFYQSFHQNQSRYNEAAESAEKYLRLTEQDKLSNKLDLALIYLLLGWISLVQGNQTRALESAMKGLELNKELNHAIGIADEYSLIGRIHLYEGDYNQAKQYCKQALSLNEISGLSRLEVLDTLSDIYIFQGKYNRGIKYRQQVVTLVEKLHFPAQLITHLIVLGYHYRFIAKHDLTIKSYERALKLAEKEGFISQVGTSLYVLMMIYNDKGLREMANQFHSRLAELHEQTMDKIEIDLSTDYLFSKAYMMKTSPRLRDRIEAQSLYRKLLDEPYYLNTNLGDLNFCIVNLCDLLLEELSLSNSPEILEEITPLLKKSLEMAEQMRNYHWLAETKLLQAKLALIKIDF
ncbi:MAG: hypothetical protein ACXAAI_16310, partial [Promethearchaeota archaeon]